MRLVFLPFPEPGLTYPSPIVAANVGAKYLYTSLFRHSPLLTSKSVASEFRFLSVRPLTHPFPPPRFPRSWKAQGAWLAIIFSVWLAGFVFAELIPFFSQLLTIISSLTSLWFVVGMGGFVYLHLVNPKLPEVVDGGYFKRPSRTFGTIVALLFVSGVSRFPRFVRCLRSLLRTDPHLLCIVSAWPVLLEFISSSVRMANFETNTGFPPPQAITVSLARRILAPILQTGSILTTALSPYIQGIKNGVSRAARAFPDTRDTRLTFFPFHRAVRERQVRSPLLVQGLDASLLYYEKRARRARRTGWLGVVKSCGSVRSSVEEEVSSSRSRECQTCTIIASKQFDTSAQRGS